MSEVSGWESGLATHSALKKWKNSRHNKNSKICEIINIHNQFHHFSKFAPLHFYRSISPLCANTTCDGSRTRNWIFGHLESSEIMRSILKTHLLMVALPKPETQFSCTLSITNYYICTKYICICIYIYCRPSFQFLI